MSFIFTKSASFCDILRHSFLETRNWRLETRCSESHSQDGCTTSCKRKRPGRFGAVACARITAPSLSVHIAKEKCHFPQIFQRRGDGRLQCGAKLGAGMN